MKKILFILTFIFLFSGIYISSIIRIVSQEPRPGYGHIVLRSTEGDILTDKGLPGGYMLPYRGTLSGKLFDAILYIEDKRFREHYGIDWQAKLSGIIENIQVGRVVRGGSTITEQYIKNTFFRGKKRDMIQKIDEAIAAMWIELTHTKEEILRGYLDNIYFGNNTYGLQAALKLYFPGKNPDDLTQEDILDIITLIHSPNVGVSNKDEWLRYRKEIASRLGWNVGIGGLEKIYIRNSIEYYPMITERIRSARYRYCTGDTRELSKWTYKIPYPLCESESIDLQLSISLRLQNYSNEVIQKTISRIEKENVTGSAVYVYNPTDKKVLAYVGNRGVSSLDGEIDMITRRRSVGSILKPFIYLLALREGAELESYILDDTRTYPTGNSEKVFVPQNYNPVSYGPVRLREALGNSLNSSTVRLSESIGIGHIYNFFESVGLSLDHDAGYYGYGISLGTVELSLENIVESYAYLVNSDDADIFLIKKALSENKNRARTFGISSILGSSLDIPVKTGTSTDFRDNWAVSYHEDAIIGIWVGNTDGSGMKDVSGISGAGPIWHTIVEYMIARGFIKNISNIQPSGVIETLLCLDTSCFQKENVYMKNPNSIKSRPKNNIYYEEDFVGVITQEEKEKWNIQ